MAQSAHVERENTSPYRSPALATFQATLLVSGKGLVLAEDVSRAFRDAQAASMEQLRQVMLTPLESDGEGVSAAVEPAVTDAGLGGRTSG